MPQQGSEPIPVGAILHVPHWPGPVRVEPRGSARVLVEAVTLDDNNRLLSRLFRIEDLAGLQIEPDAGRPALDGDPLGFRLAAEATRIRLAYTHDPQFAARVAHIDPLPHQMEAVYHYMLRQPRLRFLLADDPGAGKTIMAGLLLKEMKLRGAVTRILILASANLVPQWQREMAEKFDEPFDLVDRALLAARDARAWDAGEQCLVSMDFAWQADVLESLARARRWDLIVVDEAHKMERRHLDDLRRRQTHRLVDAERAAVLSMCAPEVLGVGPSYPLRCRPWRLMRAGNRPCGAARVSRRRLWPTALPISWAAAGRWRM